MDAIPEALIPRLLAAVEQAYNCVAVSDIHGVLEYVNPAFERMSGYTASEVVGSTFKRLQSGVHDAAFYNDLKETLQRGEVWHGHFVNRKKSGSLYEEEATISPVRDGQGAVTGFVAVKRDVTHQRAVERELAATQQREAALRSERSVLDETVGGTVRMLTEVLAMTRPSSFARASRIADYVDGLCAELGWQDWHLSMAARLSQVGVVAIPDTLHEKADSGLPLDEEESRIFDGHPRLAQRLLARIPRFERVAALVATLAPAEEAEVSPPDPPCGDSQSAVPSMEFQKAAAVLRGAAVFDERICAKASRAEAIEDVRSHVGPDAGKLVAAFKAIPLAVETMTDRRILLNELRTGMVLRDDIVSPRGTLLARGDQDVTLTLLMHFRRIADAHGVREPFLVSAPTPAAALRDSPARI